MAVNGNGSPDLKFRGSTTRFWRKFGTPISTWVFGHLFFQPSRDKHAASVSDQVKPLGKRDREVLTGLLVLHKLVKPGFIGLDPAQLVHFHFCKIERKKRIDAFIKDFNEDPQFLNRYRITYDPVAEHFSIIAVAGRAAPAKASPPMDLASVALQRELIVGDGSGATDLPLEDQIRRYLQTAQIPQRFSSIVKNTSRSEAEVATELGRMMDAGEVIGTVTFVKGERRYFLASRMPEHLGHSVSYFSDCADDPVKMYIYHKDRDQLLKTGALRETWRLGGDGVEVEEYVSAKDFKRFRSTYTEIQGRESSVWVRTKDLPHYIETRQVVRGLEDDGKTVCYIYGPAQNQYALQVFNAFVFPYLEGHYKEKEVLKAQLAFLRPDEQKRVWTALIASGAIEKGTGEVWCPVPEKLQTLDFLTEKEMAKLWLILNWAAEGRDVVYKKLRVAFEAGVAAVRPGSVDEFLYEARRVAGIRGDILAVTLALSGNGESVHRLKECQLFNPRELSIITTCHERLEYAENFPFLIGFGFAHAQQGFMNYMYDQADYYQVFQLLLVRKLNTLRVMQPQPGARMEFDPFVAEVDLIYAPMAEKRGWVELAGDMRELVFKLTDPVVYEATNKIMTEHVEMDLAELRRHLSYIADIFGEEMQKEGLGVTGWSSRVKERAAYHKNRLEKPYEDGRTDFSGIRFRCRTLEESDVLVSWVKGHFVTATKEQLLTYHGAKQDVKAEEDSRREPKATGWRGYRVYVRDPFQTGPHKRPRVISLQILTEEMEKEDKLGKAGHWLYKGLRASVTFVRKLSHETGARGYKRQVFDVPPTREYTRNAEHDFYVDQRVARQHKRVFVWAEDALISGVDFSEHPMAECAILRFKPEAKVEDVVAFKAYKDLLVEGYSYAQAYQAKFDRKTGKMKIVPVFREPKVGRLAVVPNGSILVLCKSGNFLNLSEADLVKIRSNADTLRARYLASLKLSVLRGKLPSALLVENRVKIEALLTKIKRVKDGMTEVLKSTELYNEEEVCLAYVLDLLKEDEIDRVLGILIPKVSLGRAEKGRSRLTILTPARRELISDVLDALEGFQVLSASYATVAGARGLAPAEMELLLRPEAVKADHKPKGAAMVPDTEFLEGCLKDLQQARSAVASDVRSRETEDATQIEINILASDRNYWEGLKDVCGLLKSKGLEVLELGLPDVSFKKPGRILAEYGGGILTTTEVEGLANEITKAKTFHKGVEARIIASSYETYS